jgi:hypothetical protein
LRHERDVGIMDGNTLLAVKQEAKRTDRSHFGSVTIMHRQTLHRNQHLIELLSKSDFKPIVVHPGSALFRA